MSKFFFNNVARYDKAGRTPQIDLTCTLVNIFAPEHINRLAKLDPTTKGIIIYLVGNKLGDYVDNITDDTKRELYKYLYDGQLSYNLLESYFNNILYDNSFKEVLRNIIITNIDTYFINIINDMITHANTSAELKQDIYFDNLKMFISSKYKGDYKYFYTNYLTKQNINVNSELFKDVLKNYKEQIERTYSQNIHKVIYKMLDNYISLLGENIFTYVVPPEVMNIIFKIKDDIQIEIDDSTLFPLVFFDYDKMINDKYDELIVTLKGSVDAIIDIILAKNNILINLKDFLNKRINEDIHTNVINETRKAFYNLQHPELSSLIMPNPELLVHNIPPHAEVDYITYTYNEIIVKSLNIKITIYKPGDSIINYQFDNNDSNEVYLIKTGLYEFPININELFYDQSNISPDDLPKYNITPFKDMSEFMDKNRNTTIISFCEFYLQSQLLVKKYIV